MRPVLDVHEYTPHPTIDGLCAHCPAPEGNRRHLVERAPLAADRPGPNWTPKALADKESSGS